MLEATEQLAVGILLYEDVPSSVERLIASLRGALQAIPDVGCRVAVRDHSPTDALRQVCADALPEAAYRHAPDNPGFGAGHNALMAEAFDRPSIRHYVCVNPDAVLHPDCLSELWKESSRQERAGLVEALQFPDEHPKGHDPVTHATPWCSGCVLMISRELNQSIGGFDERFFMYCEDVDLSWRARAAGFDTSIAPAALAHHYVGNRGEDEIGRRRQMLRSCIQLAAKYAQRKSAAAWMKDYVALGGSTFPLGEPDPAAASVREIVDFTRGYWCRPRW